MKCKHPLALPPSSEDIIYIYDLDSGLLYFFQFFMLNPIRSQSLIESNVLDP